MWQCYGNSLKVYIYYFCINVDVFVTSISNFPLLKYLYQKCHNWILFIKYDFAEVFFSTVSVLFYFLVLLSLNVKILLSVSKMVFAIFIIFDVLNELWYL